ncbi:class I SAM-dependent methyltransferase [Paenibacillus sp. MMS18-CY102]|uniref:class I SAM-dependent methyltransferase n=1 Tax=Paenibacillus sp. MMS18-CY102 TaxID=2682849 RepID=UPI00136613A8|nr:methyltransferase domain-containing protein [Paenibacillus sp. MMS18-CY102]MWC28900.1 methyltransferase domain-containing protein [Paenibacillus sp. MMS18-CY102]
MSENKKEIYEQVGVAATCRGFEEYKRMFVLPDELGQSRILDIAGGAASFTADCHAQGIDAIAVDPRYALGPELMLADGKQEIETSTEKLRALSHRFDWTFYGNIDLHREGRLRSYDKFAADYALSTANSRYIAGSLPELPFETGTFDFVLCSHFLFLYAEQFDASFHERAVLEMMRLCRAGGQVRIYPLLSLRWEPYPHMDKLLEAIRQAGGRPRFERSQLPFMPGSEDLLAIEV